MADPGQKDGSEPMVKIVSANFQRPADHILSCMDNAKKTVNTALLSISKAINTSKNLDELYPTIYKHLVQYTQEVLIN